MDIAHRATLKRLCTLICSIGTIVCYGYLLGGTGGYLFGQGRPLTALAGFVGGTLLAVVALRVWKSYLGDVQVLNEREGRNGANDVAAGPESDESDE